MQTKLHRKKSTGSSLLWNRLSRTPPALGRSCTCRCADYAAEGAAGPAPNSEGRGSALGKGRANSNPAMPPKSTLLLSSRTQLSGPTRHDLLPAPQRADINHSAAVISLGLRRRKEAGNHRPFGLPCEGQASICRETGRGVRKPCHTRSGNPS